MRRIELIINQSRRDTDNTEFSDTTGLSDDDFLQWANDGQERLQSLILGAVDSVFEDEKIIQCVAGQEAYDIPDDAFLSDRITMVEVSVSGSGRDYYELRQASRRERLSGQTSVPSFYIRRNNQILLQPKPESSASLLRVTYQKRLPKLDKRRAKVASVSLASDTITSLTLDTTISIDRTQLLEEDYVTVADKDGVIKMKNIPVTDIDETTGVVTVDASFTFEDGETIAAGDYLLRGPRSTTHSQMDDNCERYLLAYMSWKAQHKDSNSDLFEQSEESKAMEADILASFSEPDADVDYVPILDGSFLDTD